jgi:ricin-type beta-trefoil lectin domain
LAHNKETIIMKPRKTPSITLILLFVILTVVPSHAQMLKGKYIIASKADMEYVLAVPNSRYNNGQKLILWEYHSDYADQKFKINREHDNIISIMPADATDKLLAIPESKIGENFITILWQRTNGNEQYWQIEHISGLIYVIRSRLNPDYVLAVCGTPGNNSDVVIQRYTGSENQKWVIFTTDSKFYPTYKLTCDHNK